MMYLSPSLRRDFLDNVLSSSFPEYLRVLKDYKKSLISRNKVLKNISKGRSSKDEIIFWDNEFIKNAIGVYDYRERIKQYLEKNSHTLES